MDGAERSAFEQFAHIRLDALLRFGLALTGDPVLATDLVQEALVRTAMRWSRVAKDGDPYSYVRRTMVNTRISWWRRLRNERLVERVPDRAVSTESHDPMLWDAIRSLPSRQRAVVALRFYEDLSEEQTARVLGCTVGTVKSQQSRAIAKLRRVLTKEWETT